MTKEQIQDRIKDLETQREQVRATLLAYDGALQDCNYWLQEIDKPVVEIEPVKE